MTTSLRSRVVEAGARAIANDRAEELDEQHFDDAEAAFVGFVDCLTENADEWDDLAARDVEDPPMRDNPPWAGNFIAVLMEDR